MLFLIALIVAVLFAAFLSPALRKAPLPFYLAAALLAAGAAVAAQLDMESDLLLDWVLPLFNRGAAAAAFWALVMWAGALPRGSRAGKRLLAVRGELSSFAAILTLCHAVLRGLMYLRQLLRPRFSPDGVFLATCLTVLLLLLIMLPLTVLSFKAVRRRMAAKRWKHIQRLAYLFYGLIYIHVLILYLPPALQGLRGYGFSVLLYSALWLSYLVFRLRKHFRARKLQ